MLPVPFTNVKITDEFWAPRLKTNREVTLPIEYKHCKKSGRYDAWKWKPGKPKEPHIFWDSDVAKWLEAAAYSLATHPDPKLERQVDAYVEMLEAGQGKDGYLNSHYSLVEPDKRWSNLRDCCELYCAGHLIEAAVAYAQATGKEKFLDVMCRYADLIDKKFGTKRGQMRGYPGHQELELALVKLCRITGEKRYLDLSKFFIDERGRQPHYYDREAHKRGDEPRHFHFRSYAYNQSHLPVREQKEVVGHSVRAFYMYTGMADVAAETGDRSLIAACKRLWVNATQKRMFVTGGIGPTSANEGFTIDYDLPTEKAYAETCAAIALVFFAQRMLHMDADSQYADVMERALYNGVLSGVSLSGDRFFYQNPLAVFPALNEFRTHHESSRRQEWFGCACCPTNIVRMLASLGGYIYSQGKSEARINLFVDSSAEMKVGKQNVQIQQATKYPWNGKVKVTVRPERPAEFTLSIRIPAWCRSASLSVNGKSISASRNKKKGFARIKREWRPGDRVELDLPMPVERIEASPKVRQTCGRVALQRGPIVYCLEEADNGNNLNDLSLPKDAKLSSTRKKDFLGGVNVITGKAVRRRTSDWNRELYRPSQSRTETVKFTAVPYYAWANRAEGEMLVWMHEG